MDGLEYAVNHVFMPPRLPETAEQTLDFAQDFELAQLVADCAGRYALEDHGVEGWDAVQNMLESVADLHRAAPYPKRDLENRFATMFTGSVTALLVRPHNAGLIFRVFDEHVIVEVFEVSALASSVLECEGKLAWSFPSCAASIPTDNFYHYLFQEHLASFISQMNKAEEDDTKTALIFGKEPRDTAHPRFISDLLMSILAAAGGEDNGFIAPERRVQKRINDDVFGRSNQLAWRRSSLWLLIRVALQTTFAETTDYKQFMIYFMSTLLEKSTRQDLHSSLLDVMCSKLARRVGKLGDITYPFVLEKARAACDAAQAKIMQRWSTIQAAEAEPMMDWDPLQLDLVADTRLELRNSSDYVESVLLNHTKYVVAASYAPSHVDRLQSFGFDDILCNHTLSSFVESKDPSLMLMDFEAAVRDELPEWLEEHSGDAAGPTALTSKIQMYGNLAKKWYHNNPESLSTMVLTILELWVALDKATVQQYPGLAKYPPEIPRTLLHPLLLRKRQELERVKAVARYITRRTSEAKFPSVFGPTTADSLSVRYYDRDNKMKDFRQQIETTATKDRDAKLQELARMMVTHREWKKRYNAAEHSELCGSRASRKRNRNFCDKCSIGFEEPTIKPYEWPLPSNILELKNVIFELNCPPPLAAWREGTYYILRDLLSPKDSFPSSHISISLSDYMQKHAALDRRYNRITLGSTSGSHSAAIHLPAEPSQVCLDCPMEWERWDSTNRTFIHAEYHKAESLSHCTLEMPPSTTYKGLGYAISGTKHTENWVMSKQAECPADLSLHEYVAFGCLRSGPHLQWMNIASAFATRSLTFSAQPVYILIAQAAQQVGTLSATGDADWHVELKSPSFCERLLEVVKRVLAECVDNWREAVTVKSIVLVVTRLLAALTPTQGALVQRAREILASAREITYEWLKTMVGQLETTSEKQIDATKTRICDVAAICCLTYDIDDPDLSPEKLAILIHCSIILQDNSPAQRDTSSSPARLSYDRVQRLFHALEETLCASIDDNATGLDDAVQAVWPAYSTGSAWERMGDPNERWMFTESSSFSARGQVRQNVQINLLSGELLIDGKPIGNLPKKITTDAVYIRLFGKSVLRVVPAGIPGLDYKTVLDVSGYEVFFATKAEGELIVRARPTTAMGGFLEYIPHNKFKDDLPVPFVENYAHWLQLSSGRIEFRPISSLWTTSILNWNIDFTTRRMENYRGHALVEPRSRTFRMIHHRLDPLEHSSFTVITMTGPNSVDINLPRFHLDFVLEKVTGTLECHTFPNTIVDENQCIGTLMGLRSKLVLCEKSVPGANPAVPITRRVLVPRGVIQFFCDDDHLIVTVETDVEHKRSVAYMDYVVNTKLGMLVGNGNLESRLYKVYLHALASHSAPDPTIGRTGTEEALNELASAACLSFQSLSDAELELLQHIRTLTPQRAFHPPSKRLSQVVTWLDLPQTSQVSMFATLVKRILVYNDKLAVFRTTPPPEATSKESPANAILERRAALRERGYVNVPTLPENASSSSVDMIYRPRDTTRREVQHYATALMIASEKPTVYTINSEKRSLFHLFQKWAQVGKPRLTNSAMSYSRSWLMRGSFKHDFISLFKLCVASETSLEEKKYALLFSLATYSFHGDPCPSLPYLVAFMARSDLFEGIQPPPWTSFDLTEGVSPSLDSINHAIERHVRELRHTPSHNIMQVDEEERNIYLIRRKNHYTAAVHSRAALMETAFAGKWDAYVLADGDASVLSLPRRDYYNEYYDFDRVVGNVSVLFQTCYHALKLQEFAEEVQSVLDELDVPAYSPKILTPDDSSSQGIVAPRIALSVHLTPLAEVLTQHAAPDIDILLTSSFARPPASAIQPDQHSVDGLRTTLQQFSDSTVLLHTLYGGDLKTSLLRLEASFGDAPVTEDEEMPIDLEGHHEACLQDYQDIWNALTLAVAPSSSQQKVLRFGTLWPRLSVRDALYQMTRRRWHNLSPEWRTFLIKFAVSLIRLQQAERLLLLKAANKIEDLDRELQNICVLDVGRFMAHPDWLLIMIEHNFVARDVQCKVALEMFQPSSRENTALQLNMGEGKSSVIVPMVATSLSNQKRLVRIVILKALAKQMFQLLVDRVSSLPDRRVCYFPFSRQMKLDLDALKQIQNLYVECVASCGIVIVQPEHILSSKLLTVDRLLSSFESSSDAAECTSDALQAFKTQVWLDQRARDILDESDELLHVRYQLIYTMGSQMPMEGHPGRWVVIQNVLEIVEKEISKFGGADDVPAGFEVKRSSVSAFPHAKFPYDDGGNLISTLLSESLDKIVAGCLPGLNTSHFGHVIRETIRRFVTVKEVSAQDRHLLKRNFADSTSMDVLLILRGLFAHGLLVYGLQNRRWRVDYGLDLSRSLLAVPYRAKDVPSLRSEFGHPDIAILLTCLAYYYHGLNMTQMYACLEHLLALSNSADHYTQWVANIPPADLPAGLRDFTGINIDDPKQQAKIFELFRFNFIVINFYLTNIVFPKAAKEFPHKLPTSGWDLAETKRQVTTGFSGTNDNRYLLPTSIRQEDPVDQGGTNALVLTYLLRPENSIYCCTCDANGRSDSGQDIIGRIASHHPQIRVLLDVGAQMLDMSNQGLVEFWLGRIPEDVEAAIFFNLDDELTTITRDGTIEPLISSPYRQQTDKCIVYLDDAHTRGTDLKLPRDWKAAVTLGKKVTKDRLVQGCMRMRQLGRGQSLAFFAPPEVDAAIRKVADKENGRAVQTTDIIKWSMLETCADIEHHAPQWLQQGIDYEKRRKTWDLLPLDSSPDADDIQPLRQIWLQQEARSLREMYDPRSLPPPPRRAEDEYPDLRRRLQALGLEYISDQNLDEEQEREVIHEMEVERQPERPPPLPCVEHILHPDVCSLVQTGQIRDGSPAFSSLPGILKRIKYWSTQSFAKSFESNLLVTADFSTTMEISGRVGQSDIEFWKRCHWILSSTHRAGDGENDFMVLISQFEAQQLLPSIRKPRSGVRLHVYSPRVTRNAQPFDDLDFYCVPPVGEVTTLSSLRPLVLQLNVFAGQLYPSSFKDHEMLCNFIGVDCSGAMPAQADGFVRPEDREPGMLVDVCRFSASPIRFLRELFSLRRKGHDFSLTPVGKLLDGRKLLVSDFD